MRRILAAAAVLACTLTGVTACGDDDEGGPKVSDAEPKVVKIRFSDGSVTPNGDRVGVEVGQTVQFIVAADSSGEIHIHSEPEHVLEYSEGEKEFEVSFDKPGVVEVEAHDPEQTIVQLEIR